MIATGVYKAREIDLPGSDLANIFPAMEFLTASNKKGLGDKVQLFDDGICKIVKKKYQFVADDVEMTIIGTCNKHKQPK